MIYTCTPLFYLLVCTCTPVFYLLVCTCTPVFYLLVYTCTPVFYLLEWTVISQFHSSTQPPIIPGPLNSRGKGKILGRKNKTTDYTTDHILILWKSANSNHLMKTLLILPFHILQKLWSKSNPSDFFSSVQLIKQIVFHPILEFWVVFTDSENFPQSILELWVFVTDNIFPESYRAVNSFTNNKYMNFKGTDFRVVSRFPE